MIDIDNKYNDSNQEVPAWDDIPEVATIDESALGHSICNQVESLAGNTPFADAANKLRSIFLNLVGNYVFVHNARSIVDYLKVQRDRMAGANFGRGFDKKTFIAESIISIVELTANEGLADF